MLNHLNAYIPLQHTDMCAIAPMHEQRDGWGNDAPHRRPRLDPWFSRFFLFLFTKRSNGPAHVRVVAPPVFYIFFLFLFCFFPKNKFRIDGAPYFLFLFTFLFLFWVFISKLISDCQNIKQLRVLKKIGKWLTFCEFKNHVHQLL